ncbi:hypothetical protein BGX21_011422 [Mortierella sp. AD011]|nr:hypothetical protein BGX21_011422 [Mortierella sp. AD011]
MSQSVQETTYQIFQPAHRCNETGQTLPLSDKIKIKYRFDKTLGQYFVLWNDILTVFSDAMHARNGDTAVVYLTDENFEFLQPLRIGAYPGIVLDIIIELPEYSLISESSKAHSKSIYLSSASSNFRDIKRCPTIASIDGERVLELVPADTDTLQTSSATQQPSNDDSKKSSTLPSGPPDHTPKVALDNENGIDIQSASNSEYAIRNFSLENMPSTQEQTNVYSKAIYDRGLAHYEGKGVPQDYVKANEYFLDAVGRGYAAARNKLGYMCHHGQGVAQDYTKAVEWYTLAATQGCRKSQCDLGDMYCDGKGVSQDYYEGLNWYKKAAEQNCPVAQYNIGSMYLNRKVGFIHDYAVYGAAAEWYRQSAIQGYVKAQYMLGSLLSGGEGAGIYRPLETFPNETFGRFVGAAYQGCAKSQYNIGLMYDSGKTVLLDHSKATEWFRRSANQGYAPAQYCLGLKYHSGQSVARSDEIAVGWYRKAADQGDVEAQYQLGCMYELGQGVAYDLLTAAE